MANRVTQFANLPQPSSIFSFSGIQEYLTQLLSTLQDLFSNFSMRANGSYQSDGTEILDAPLMLKSYVKAALPSASKYVNGMIIVSNDTGGLTPAFSDGTNWRRTADRNIIS